IYGDFTAACGYTFLWIVPGIHKNDFPGEIFFRLTPKVEYVPYGVGIGGHTIVLPPKAGHRIEGDGAPWPPAGFRSIGHITMHRNVTAAAHHNINGLRALPVHY